MDYDRETEVRETAANQAATTPQSAAPTHTTIIREKRGSGGVMIALIAVVALLVAGFLFLRGQDSEVMRDAAIADAAQQVGDSAQQAGQAIENAANDVTGGE